MTAQSNPILYSENIRGRRALESANIVKLLE